MVQPFLSGDTTWHSCYLKWRCYEKYHGCGSTIFQHLEKQIESECEVSDQHLRRMLDVTLSLGDGGLTFIGDSQRTGDVNNGNFLEILELLSHYDLLFETHLNRVRNRNSKGINCRFIIFLVIHRTSSLPSVHNTSEMLSYNREKMQGTTQLLSVQLQMLLIWSKQHLISDMFIRMLR